MPELPEVETFARQLRPLVLNKKIREFSVLPGGERLIGGQDLDLMQKILIGDSIREIGRHGKYIIFNLASQNRIVAHLRMSGKFVVTKGKFDNKFNRLFMRFEDQSYLNFTDIRKFATFNLEEVQPATKKNKITKIGPDAISDEFDFDYFYKQTQRSKRAIYSVLLDQSVIAGIGNIYANEALFESKVHPLSAANSLTSAQVKNMLKIIKDLLAWAINFKGTTLVDKTYSDLEGNFGEFANHLKVYGKKKANCVECNSAIEHIRIQQRTVYYCPHCQKL